VLVHESLKTELIDRVLARFAAVKIGDTLTEEMVAFTGPQMGPVISKAQYDKIWVFKFYWVLSKMVSIR